MNLAKYMENIKIHLDKQYEDMKDEHTGFKSEKTNRPHLLHTPNNLKK